MGYSQQNSYIKRNERLTKVKELLECGVAPRDICKQLVIKWDQVQDDIKILAVINQGSLSPEICAEKRLVIDDKFLGLDTEAMVTYKALIEIKSYKIAAEYLKISVDIQKFRAKLWGLEEDLSKFGGLSAQNVSFNKVDINLINDNDMDKMRKTISRQDENMSHYE